ncbi:hypothetical protein GCM10027162_49640 [Streptomyces incanus]
MWPCKCLPADHLQPLSCHPAGTARRFDYPSANRSVDTASGMEITIYERSIKAPQAFESAPHRPANPSFQGSQKSMAGPAEEHVLCGSTP